MSESSSDTYEKEVEEECEGFFELPRSTMYRLLKRLVKVGLVEVYRGVDYRTRYYKLSELGKRVLEKVLSMIREFLRDKLMSAEELGLGSYRGFRGLRLEDFNKLVSKTIGVEPSLVAKLLNAKIVNHRYDKYVLIDYRPQRVRA